MKINAGLFSLALAGFSALAAAQPHGKHARVHGRHAKALKERDMVYEVTTVWTTILGTPTAQPTSIYVQDNRPSSSPSPTPAPKKDGKKGDKKGNSSSGPSSSISSSTNKGNSGSSNSNTGTSSNTGAGSSTGTDREFPDGVVSCNEFPSDYGALALPWHIPAGWSGLQYQGGNIDAEGVCKEGAYCSYACPPGYSKAQWPADQPASGESIGGLLCKNGKLTLTRSDFKYLCEAGAPGISIKNELSDEVSVCRTDYPGCEGMVIPLQCDPGTEQVLTAPDADTPGAFTWRGGATSAQYYVNNAGVSIKDGCVWGQSTGIVGNWAPYIFGAGKKGNKIWISVSKNPNNSGPANYNVSIVGGTGSCECTMGVCQDNGAGCTVAVDPGQKAYFRLWK
ncbi:hypothetical protein B9Z19DRAFT_1099792 [Tuber borchii]|uniref:Uncharacterized protein n=1 Tax=Tuber borchii TaxID=42251 RepID=A0A2T7A0Y2_TUBBO|nr:hypothetical protein B9Z19DRAFT_1099792 [Tuber borchii]